MPRSRSRPRSAPPAPRSTGAGARPPLPPGPRRTGGRDAPSGGGGHAHGMGAAGRALQRGLPAAMATRAGNYSSPFNYLSAPSSSSRADSGAGGGRAGGAAPLSAGSGWSPGAGCPQCLPSPPLRAAAARLRPLLLLLAGLRGTGGPFPGWTGGGTSGVPKGQGAAALPRPPRPCPGRPRSPQGSVPCRAPFPHGPVPRTGAGRGRPDSAEPRAGEAPLRPRRSGRSPRRRPAPRRIF